MFLVKKPESRMVDGIVNNSSSPAVEVPGSPSEVNVGAPCSGSSKERPHFHSRRVLAVAITHARQRKAFKAGAALAKTLNLLHIRTLSPNGWRTLKRPPLRGSPEMYFSETDRIT